MTQHRLPRRPLSPTLTDSSETDSSALTDAVAALQDSAAALHAQDPAMASATAHREAAWCQRHADLVAFLPDAYVVTDVAGRVREANPALALLLGFGRRYALGKPLAAFVHPDERSAFEARLAQFAQRSEERVQERTLSFKAPARRHTERLTVRARVAPLHHAGRQVGLHWLLRDITDQTATAAMLQDLTAQLEQRVRERTAELEATLAVYQALTATAPPALRPARDATT